MPSFIMLAGLSLLAVLWVCWGTPHLGWTRKLSNFIEGVGIFCVVAPALLSIATGAFLLLQSAVGWLRTAQWHGVTFREFLISSGPVDIGPTGWLGFDKIVAWMADMPAPLWLILAGPVVWVLFWGWVADHLAKWRDEIRDLNRPPPPT